jgi:hypothetical protein
MFATKEPTSSFISIGHHQPDFFQNGAIELQIEDLVNIIKSQITQKKLEDLSKSLHEKMFALRTEAILYFANEGNLKQILHIKFDEQLKNDKKNDKLKLLKNILRQVLIQHNEIFSEYNLDSQTLKYASEKPHFSAFDIFELHHDVRVKFTKKCINYSLDFEFALVISDLVITNEINLTENQINDNLIPFLKQSITSFGAYSIFTGFWTPKNMNENQIMINTKILASTLELEFGNKRKLVSAEIFQNMLQN